MTKFFYTLIFTFLILGQSLQAQNTATTLVINEIMVGNTDVFMDPSLNYGGWIELYNPTSSSISLNGMYISDDPTNYKKYALTSVHGSIGSMKYKTLWFDHYSTGNEYSSNSNKQIDFKLDADGDTIYISDRNGKPIIIQPYPKCVSRVSYARTLDGGDEWSYTSTPTPDATNAGSTFANEQIAAPVVDRGGTVYNKSFDIHVDIPEGAILRYTTDGSTPTLTNGETSEEGVFNIGGQKNYAFRFRLYKEGFLPSEVVTHTYIYNLNNYYLPIVSVVTDEKHLYDSRIGAYVDGTNGIGGNGGNNNQNSNKNRSWERPVNFEYLMPDTDEEYSMVLNQEVDFEVSGGWSRHFPPSPSFKLKSSKRYGLNELPYPLFPEKPYIKNKAITVRNGGNDCDCRIVDAAIHEILLSSGFHLDCQTYQPVHVFINGEYQFMFNIRETNNKNFAYSNYGIDKDEIDQFEYAGGGGYTQKAGDDTAFIRWTTLCNDLSSNPNDATLYQQICDLCDIDEVCNYFATECYVGSQDWITNNNNIKGFRARPDGKFHLVFMDVDEAFAKTNIISEINGGGGWWWGGFDNKSISTLFTNLLKHEGFKKQFIDTFCIVAGSIFDSNRVKSIMTRMANYSEAALAMDGKNPWTTNGIHNGSNRVISGRNLLNDITDKTKREERINSIRTYFNLDNGYQVNISSNLPAATIAVNNVKIPTGKFEGTLFTPAVLSTDAPAGYEFKGWMVEGGGGTVSKQLITSTDKWNYYDKGSLDANNWKSPTYSIVGWGVGQAPFGYGNLTGMTNSQADYATTLNYGTDANNKRPTYYFRKNFTLAKAPEKDDRFTLTYYVDDGCVIYLNGQEVTRYLMSGTPTFNQFSDTHVGNVAYTETIEIDPNMFRQGSNTIAVEVHNNSATSSDIYWTASLTQISVNQNEEAATIPDPTLDLASLSSDKSCTIMACYEPVADEDIAAQLDSQPYAPIRINEVSAGNTVYVNEYCKKNDWIELYNNTDTVMNVAGLYISDNPDKPMKYQIPASQEGLNTLIQPGSTLVLWADKLEPLTSLAAVTPLLITPHTLFKLSNEDGQEVIITSSEEFVANNPSYFERHPSFKHFADHLVYQAHLGDQSVGRYPDGSNQLYVFNRPTIGKANASHTYDSYIGLDDGILYDITNGIDGLMADHPEPTISYSDGMLNLSTSSSSARLTVYNSIGQVCMQRTISPGTQQLPIRNLSTGIYVAHVDSHDGPSLSIKFIIK